MAKHGWNLACVVVLAAASASTVRAADAPVRRLPLAEYQDKMKAGWLGQMIGVSWGGPTEWRYIKVIMPEDKVPAWHEGMANDAFGQDDLYVEMTFLRSLEQYGYEVSAKQAGIDFANSKYNLWAANRAGRDNLRKGIAPPDSGHPQFSEWPDAIDYQIEADFSGLVAPGMPNTAIALGEKFGHIINYGDGVYGGQFIGGLYAEAFFETDPVKIVEAGLKCIPKESQYAEMVRDVLAQYKADPKDWQKAFAFVNDKYNRPEYARKTTLNRDRNIDAKINGAFVLVGILYGQRDLDKTAILSLRCGQDSDCNPSSAVGVIATTYGFSKLPEKYRQGLDETKLFNHTEYNFPMLIKACEKVAREALAKAGGQVEKDSAGQEVLVIPVVAPKLGALEQSGKPGPVSNSKYTPEEMAKMGAKAGKAGATAPSPSATAPAPGTAAPSPSMTAPSQ